MKISVMTLGCKVNKYESDALINQLLNKGYQANDKLESADVFIINTCAVTKEAEKKSRQMIARCKKFNPNAKFFICGCASQHNSAQFLEKDVEMVIGASGKAKIIDYIDNWAKNNKKNDEIVQKIDNINEKYEMDSFAKQNRTRAYIKIQDGCNNFCSYCIIPYLRGRSRSRELQSIIDEVKTLQSDIKEIVVTGINVSDYKINGESGLLLLLQELDKFGLRIRLSSMEDTLVDENFVKGLANLKNFCPFFHLSLQSGADNVLKRMNRHYTTEEFFNSVSLIRKYFPYAGITTDVIVGFPCESDAEFDETYRFIEKVGFSGLHIFKYSPREGTVAYKLYKDLPFEVKKQRLDKLEILNEKLKNDFITKNMDRKLEVLIEEKDGEFYVGFSKNYIRCYVKSENENLINQIVCGKIVEIYKDGVIIK
jgi:threonylcarbamoyladenosine tRNA methylthiotransferase MtaB